jgi:hypothetical protein
MTPETRPMDSENTKMKTLADYGVLGIDIAPLPDDERINGEKLYESAFWEDLQQYLDQNQKTHPNDRLWILNLNEKFTIVREVGGGTG